MVNCLPMEQWHSHLLRERVDQSSLVIQGNRACALGALDAGVSKITEETKLRAARALAGLIKRPTADLIIPDLLDARVVKTVAKAVR